MKILLLYYDKKKKLNDLITSLVHGMTFNFKLDKYIFKYRERDVVHMVERLLYARGTGIDALHLHLNDYEVDEISLILLIQHFPSRYGNRCLASSFKYILFY